MTQECAFSQAKGTQHICGLLGTEPMSTAECESRIVALREIVERFHIQWQLTAEVRGDSEDQPESGFILELEGTHHPACHRTGDPCSHCANLMLALRIIGEWLLPPDGRCALQAGPEPRVRSPSAIRCIRPGSRTGWPCLARSNERRNWNFQGGFEHEHEHPRSEPCIKSIRERQHSTEIERIRRALSSVLGGLAGLLPGQERITPDWLPA